MDRSSDIATEYTYLSQYIIVPCFFMIAKELSDIREGEHIHILRYGWKIKGKYIFMVPTAKQIWYLTKMDIYTYKIYIKDFEDLLEYTVQTWTKIETAFDFEDFKEIEIKDIYDFKLDKKAYQDKNNKGSISYKAQKITPGEETLRPA